MPTGLLDDVPKSAGDDQVTHDYCGVGGSHENGTTDEESDNDDNRFLGASDTNVIHVDVTPPNHSENENAHFHQGNFGVTSDKETTIHLLDGLGKMRKRKWNPYSTSNDLNVKQSQKNFIIQGYFYFSHGGMSNNF